MLENEKLIKASLIAGLRAFGISNDYGINAEVAEGIKLFNLDPLDYPKVNGSGLAWYVEEINRYASVSDYLDMVQEVCQFTPEQLENDSRYIWDMFEEYTCNGDFHYLFDLTTEFTVSGTIFDASMYAYIFVAETAHIDVIKIDKTQEQAEEYFRALIAQEK